MVTFNFGDNPQILLQLAVYTLVNVFLLFELPQAKLYFEISHLSCSMKVKSLSLDTCLEFAFFV